VWSFGGMTIGKKKLVLLEKPAVMPSFTMNHICTILEINSGVLLQEAGG
jgi:hypothetical protein